MKLGNHVLCSLVLQFVCRDYSSCARFVHSMVTLKALSKIQGKFSEGKKHFWKILLEGLKTQSTQFLCCLTSL